MVIQGLPGLQNKFKASLAGLVRNLSQNKMQKDGLGNIAQWESASWQA